MHDPVPPRAGIARRAFLPRLGTFLLGLGMIFTGRPALLAAQVPWCVDCGSEADARLEACMMECQTPGCLDGCIGTWQSELSVCCECVPECGDCEWCL